MIGKPKYKIDDTVTFILDNKEWTGKIYIIDPYGTFEDDSDVSYDIMVDNWGDNNDQECLFKHINEQLIKGDS